MSSTPFATLLRIDRRPSRYQAVIIVAIHLGAILSLWLSLLANILLLLTTFLVLLHLRHVWNRHIALTDATAVRQLVWEGGEEWQLRFASGDECWLSLKTPFYITAWLAVLRFDGVTVVLTPDALDADVWRLLRVRLLSADVVES